MRGEGFCFRTMPKIAIPRWVATVVCSLANLPTPPAGERFHVFKWPKCKARLVLRPRWEVPVSTHSRFVFFAVLVLILSFLSISPASASVGFQPVNPDELKKTSEPLAPGAPAIILYREVNRNDAGIFHQAGRYEEDYIRIKILTEEGRKRADIEIPVLEGYVGIS